MRIEAVAMAHCGPEAAYDFVASGEHTLEFELEVRAVKKLTDGPPWIGTRYAVTRRFGGLSSTSTVEVAVLDRPAAYVQTSGFGPIPVTGSIFFEPAPAGTRIRGLLEVGTLMLRGQLRKNIAALGRVLSTRGAA